MVKDKEKPGMRREQGENRGDSQTVLVDLYENNGNPLATGRRNGEKRTSSELLPLPVVRDVWQAERLRYLIVDTGFYFRAIRRAEHTGESEGMANAQNNGSADVSTTSIHQPPRVRSR